jgi:hypothetical protein
VLSIVLAVLAGAANAAASVLQRKVNREELERAGASRVRLIWRLAYEPMWFAGAATTAARCLPRSGDRYGLRPGCRPRRQRHRGFRRRRYRRVFTAWQTYLLIIVGPGSFVLLQVPGA